MISRLKYERLASRMSRVTEYANRLIATVFNDRVENIFDFNVTKQTDDDGNTHLELEHVSGECGYYFVDAAPDSQINIEAITGAASEKYKKEGKITKMTYLPSRIAGVRWRTQ